LGLNGQGGSCQARAGLVLSPEGRGDNEQRPPQRGEDEMSSPLWQGRAKNIGEI